MRTKEEWRVWVGARPRSEWPKLLRRTGPAGAALWLAAVSGQSCPEPAPPRRHLTNTKTNTHYQWPDITRHYKTAAAHSQLSSKLGDLNLTTRCHNFIHWTFRAARRLNTYQLRQSPERNLCGWSSTLEPRPLLASTGKNNKHTLLLFTFCPFIGCGSWWQIRQKEENVNILNSRSRKNLQYIHALYCKARVTNLYFNIPMQ